MRFVDVTGPPSPGRASSIHYRLICDRKLDDGRRWVLRAGHETLRTARRNKITNWRRICLIGSADRPARCPSRHPPMPTAGIRPSDCLFTPPRLAAYAPRAACRFSCARQPSGFPSQPDQSVTGSDPPSPHSLGAMNDWLKDRRHCPRPSLRAPAAECPAWR